MFFAAHDSLALLLMLVLFFGTVLLSLPVSFAMLLSTLIYLTMTDAAPIIAVPQNMIYLVSGISGSKIADVAAVGSVMRGEVRRHGYAPEQGAAVLGSVTPISIGTLFVAGLLPAALIAVCLMALIVPRLLIGSG